MGRGTGERAQTTRLIRAAVDAGELSEADANRMGAGLIDGTIPAADIADALGARTQPAGRGTRRVRRRR